MLIQVLKSKIHRVTVTDANLNYMGSITLDRDLMDAVGIVEGERVFIVDNNNGERFDTYVITGPRGSGTVCLNGAAARRDRAGRSVRYKTGNAVGVRINLLHERNHKPCCAKFFA